MEDIPQAYIEAFRDLAEGRTEPQAWLEWWQANNAGVEAALSRGLYLPLKPSGLSPNGIASAVRSSQTGACKLLEKLGIGYTWSDRYQVASEQAFKAYVEAEDKKETARAKLLKPRIARYKANFPRFAHFLGRRIDLIEEIGEPTSDTELRKIEAEIGYALPQDYAEFLLIAREIVLDPMLQMRSEHPFIWEHASPTRTGLICIADFWLEADGDQLLLDMQSDPSNPVVIYYAHEDPKIKLRRLSGSFREWIESLPKLTAD